MNLFHGDSVQVLRRFPNDCFDAVVTDPPYGLSFMGKKWDYDVPSVELWREVLRVLKPGGHVLSFGGTRTYHRMVVNIEDAGFEIRDQVQWLYGSGFPKSLNIGKAIDKMNGVELEVVGMGRSGSSSRAYQSEEQTTAGEYEETKSNNEWDGFGTALKPANEPICLARKPLEKGLTVAENVLKWGCGAINVDASRIEAADQAVLDAAVKRMTGNSKNAGAFQQSKSIQPNAAQGRWPANLLLDETAAEMLDAQSGISKSTGGDGYKNSMFCGGKKTGGHGLGDVGGASRFFYVAKASRRERNAGLEGMPDRLDFSRYEGNKNHHPTIKPIKLMEYLITLITPPNGTVLDPFMGSGSTGVAAKNLGFNFTGIELNDEYFEIAKRRLENKKQLELHEAY